MYMNQTEILELKNATNQIKYLANGFNFTLDTFERRHMNWGTGRKKLQNQAQGDRSTAHAEEGARGTKTWREGPANT